MSNSSEYGLLAKERTIAEASLWDALFTASCD